MTTSRRAFLAQIGCALAVAGVASRIPAEIADDQRNVVFWMGRPEESWFYYTHFEKQIGRVVIIKAYVNEREMGQWILGESRIKRLA